MEKLIKSVENVHPDKYDLTVQELNDIYDAFRHNIFELISFVFKLGFARGQKAVKKS